MFSIILPTKNRPELLRKSVENLLLQEDLKEIIIQETGLKKTELPEDKKLKHFFEEDHCWAQAVNRGIRRASGIYIGTISDDDHYRPNALRMACEELKRCQWCYGRIVMRDASGGIVGAMGEPPCWQRLLSINTIPQPAVFFKKKFYERAGQFDETLKLAADYDQWIRFYLLENPGYIDEVVCDYLVHSESLTQTRGQETLDETEKVRRRYR